MVALLQSYGFPTLFTLSNLEKVGLFRRNGSPPGLCGNGNWNSARKSMKLFVEVRRRNTVRLTTFYGLASAERP